MSAATHGKVVCDKTASGADLSAVPCRAGEEVTISYGNWSSEVFFLFFGFLPADNPWDYVILFRDLSEMIAYHDELEVSRPRARMNINQHLAQ